MMYGYKNLQYQHRDTNPDEFKSLTVQDEQHIIASSKCAKLRPKLNLTYSTAMVKTNILEPESAQ